MEEVAITNQGYRTDASRFSTEKRSPIFNQRILDNSLTSGSLKKKNKSITISDSKDIIYNRMSSNFKK